MSTDERSPFKRKKLTPFLAHEMIYDYANGTLDPDRKAALEEFLKTDHESQTLLKNIEAASAYTAKLSSIAVDAEILQMLTEAESAVSLGKRYSSWKEWPESLRWSVTAIALSVCVALIVAVIPWSRFTRTKRPGGPESVEVAQIPQPKTDDTNEVAVNEDNGSGDEPPEDNGDEGSGDDVADSGDSGDSGDGEDGGGTVAASAATLAAANKAAAEQAAKNKQAEETAAKLAAEQAAKNHSSPASKIAGLAKPPELLSRTMPTPLVAVNLPAALSVVPPNVPSEKSNQAPAPTPVPAPGTNASANLSISQTPDSHAPGDAKARGFVYRAFMTLDNLDEIGPKISSDIVALGGEKAGEVELGWKRGSGRYYHFALPDENEKKILERLQVYGPVRISKDPHPRVMPPGKVRFILWVESASDSSGGAPAGE